jgi:hypothetical protein
MVTEFHDGHASICWLAQSAACDYLSAISTLPEVKWTTDQSKSIHGLSWDTHCEDSGWFEDVEKMQPTPSLGP